MRPIALSDEALEDIDEDEFETFERNSSTYGRKTKREKPESFLDMFDDEQDEEELPDLTDLEVDDV